MIYLLTASTIQNFTDQSANSKGQKERLRMMNVFALGLLFTSLVTAGFFSPTPEKQNCKENIVLKEGHRVVVEFEKDNGNTKVSISPQDYEKGFVENMGDKLSETMEGAKGKLKEEDSANPEEIHRGFSPRELVCDAYGKCKHKIAAAIGKTKEAVAEKAHEAADKVYEVEEEASEAIGKAKDTVAHSAHRVSDEARESTENVKESVSEAVRKAKDTVSEKASEMKEGAAEQAEKAKHHVSEKAKEAEEMVENAADRVKEGAQRVKEEGGKELRGFFQRARTVGLRVLAFMVPPVSMSSVSGVLHLLGFTAAYGMCIWVTFASSYVLAVALPRHQFAMVQSKIYPVYFKAMAYCVGMALFGHLFSQRKRLSPLSVGMFQASNLVASLVVVLVNLLYLEPRATKVMFERMKKEKEEGRGKGSDDTEPSGRVKDPTTETPTRGVSSTGGSRGSAEEKQTDAAAAKAEMLRMSEMLRRLNSYSSFLNVLTLMTLTCHLVYLGQRLHVQC